MSPTPRGKLALSRIIATAACLLAFAAYSAFSPAVSLADVAPICAEGGCACQCKYGSGVYTEGACVGGRSCACVHGDNGCSNCVWSCCCQ